jgi:hypothetical protein
VINWIARFGWSVALIVGVFAVLKEEKCMVFADAMPKLSQNSPIYPYWPPERRHLLYRHAHRPPSGLPPTMGITLNAYETNSAVATWVWTSPEGRVLTAGQQVVLLPARTRR